MDESPRKEEDWVAIQMSTHSHKGSIPYINSGLQFNRRYSNNCLHPIFFDIVKGIIKIGMIHFRIKHHFQEKKFWAFQDKTVEQRLGWHA